MRGVNADAAASRDVYSRYGCREARGESAKASAKAVEEIAERQVRWVWAALASVERVFMPSPTARDVPRVAHVDHPIFPECSCM